MNGDLDREILQGRVFDDAKRAEQAVNRATDIVADLRNKDVIIRAGWWSPFGVAVIVTAALLGIGSEPFVVAIVAAGAFLLNAAVYVARRRQLSRAEASLDGNRASAVREGNKGY
jgi:hypothetical protein